MADVNHGKRNWRFKDLTGQVFGRLTVLKLECISVRNQAFWKCTCECGNETVVFRGSLLSGATQSCGCKRIEFVVKTFTKHGMSKTPEYGVLMGMIKRCYNTNEKRYKDWGGRGITVCARWLGEGGFSNFYADMGPRPSSKHSIERRDNNGPYSPENCYWATRAEQDKNKRPKSSAKIIFNGKSQSVKEWAEEFGVYEQVIRTRIKLGLPLDYPIRKKVHQSPSSSSE